MRSGAAVDSSRTASPGPSRYARTGIIAPAPGVGQQVIVRDARPSELPEVGELRVAAYRADAFLSPSSPYAATLAGLGAAGDGQVLVAVEDCRILGTVMLQTWPTAGRVVAGPDEAEIRALAVTPRGQGRGTGRALLRAAIDRAAAAGVRHLVLCTQPDMLAAHHLYEQAGFGRLPERDWSPQPGLILLAYGLPLPSPTPGRRPPD
jgi:ribosomal protein S18 acetylase RimI-like enzyme